jgi:hypothetical protein
LRRRSAEGEIDAGAAPNVDTEMIERSLQFISAATDKPPHSSHVQRRISRDQSPWFVYFLGIYKDAACKDQGVGFFTIFSKSARNK